MRHYQVLNMSPSADPEAIRRSYEARRERLAARSAAASDARELEAIQRERVEVEEAWSVLSDPARRSAYDAQVGASAPGAEPVPPPQQQDGWRTPVTRSTWFRIGVVALILGGPALWGLVRAADRGSDGAISGSGTLSVEELRVGDCFDDPAADAGDEVVEVHEVRAVPCTDGHDFEVFAVTDLAAGPAVAWPGDEAAFRQAFEACLPEFQDYVGRSYEESELYLNTIYPSDEGWRDGDRGVTCVAFDPTGDLTGTVRDSGR